MATIQIRPGLALDDVLYGAAEAGTATHVPHLAPLTWETFTAPPSWTLVPDGCGNGYKAELTLLGTRKATVKINLWIAPDLRGDQQPAPHSHPWPVNRTKSGVSAGQGAFHRFLVSVDSWPRTGVLSAI
ncbi:hypothetical protein AB0N81_41770 [Streptomyces sp. NPDC093510]|uniref:hypothetical protein n=1 Tax=Streptomyces sp. NPDC093510 TaxID=3155199 RepID=UPI003430F344